MWEILRREVDGAQQGHMEAKGVSICSEGWADAQKWPIINFTAVTENGLMFLNSVNAEREVKNKYYIAKKFEDCIREVGAQNVIQIIIDNASICKTAGAIVKSKYPQIFWTPCVVRTFNLALKNICAAKNTEVNVETYEQCSWIIKVSNDALIMKHCMRFVMFNDFQDEASCSCRN